MYLSAKRAGLVRRAHQPVYRRVPLADDANPIVLSSTLGVRCEQVLVVMHTKTTERRRLIRSKKPDDLTLISHLGSRIMVLFLNEINIF